MREIIGENLQAFFDNMVIPATKTYSGHIGHWPHFEVWEMSENYYRAICDISDEVYEQVAPEDSWWRGANGSNMGIPAIYFTVNGKRLKAWYGARRYGCYREYFLENKEEQAAYTGPDEYVSFHMPYKYRDLMEYFCEELGASTERNVCALATDLAKYNDMTMAELFERYGGAYGNN
jgi:hypothetical protein